MHDLDRLSDRAHMAALFIGTLIQLVGKIEGRLLTPWRGAFSCLIDMALPSKKIQYGKYRVAPRLGTDRVRRRLLQRVHAGVPIGATQTGMP
jgi:hypothetical protein